MLKVEGVNVTRPKRKSTCSADTSSTMRAAHSFSSRTRSTTPGRPEMRRLSRPSHDVSFRCASRLLTTAWLNFLRRDTSTLLRCSLAVVVAKGDVGRKVRPLVCLHPAEHFHRCGLGITVDRAFCTILNMDLDEPPAGRREDHERSELRDGFRRLVGLYLASIRQELVW